MKLKLFFILFVTAIGFTANAGGGGKICFIENKNQWKSNILYKTDLPSGALFLEPQCLTFNFRDSLLFAGHTTGKGLDKMPEYVKHHAFKIQFADALLPNIVAERPTSEFYNYFIGKDKSKWASNVKGYSIIKYQNIYANIDFVITGKGKSVKYDFIVKKGADVENIGLDFTGANKLRIDSEGNLVIETSVRKIIELKPYAYQLIDGIETPVVCHFKLNGNKLSYFLPAGYNKNYDLVIDPNLVFGTYSGSLADNFGYSATYDQTGHLYTAGTVFGVGYPVTIGAYQQNYAGPVNVPLPLPPPNDTVQGSDISISKFSPDGTTLLYATYLGGSGFDQPHSLCVNNSDQLYVLGSTGSSDFPVTSGSYNTTFSGGSAITFLSGTGLSFLNGTDITISRFSADGSNLLSSTYFGGSDNDGINNTLRYNYGDQARGEIIIDSNNDIYIASSTISTDLPVTPGAYQTTAPGGQNGFIAKFNLNLTNLIWATYIGGQQNDGIYSINVAKDGTLYATGTTNSNTFPVSNASYQSIYGGGDTDGFIVRLSANGQQLLNSTYLGSPQVDGSYLLQLDNLGNVFVTGQTMAVDSAIFIQNAAYYKVNGHNFITKLNSALSSVIWSTTFGKGFPSPDLVPSAFLVDQCSRVYLSGWGGTNWGVNNSNVSGLDITNDAFQANSQDLSDYYLMVIDGNASSLLYATYYGGNLSQEHVDGGTSRFDKHGIVYQSVCAGCGSHDDFPTTPDAYSTVNPSPNCNNGVFKFNFDFQTTVADFLAPIALCSSNSISFSNQSEGAQSYVWDFGDNTPTETIANPSHTFSQPGSYTVTLIAINPNNCNTADTAVRVINVVDNPAVDAGNDKSICGTSNVTIGFIPPAGSTDNYLWSPSVGLSSDTIPNPVANPVEDTEYILTVSNPQGCISYDTVQVTITEPPTVSDITYAFSPGCSNVLVALNNSATGGTEFYWGIDGTYYPASGNDTIIQFSYNTQYIISYIAGIGACKDTFTVTINTADYNGLLGINDVNVFTPNNGDDLNNCFSPAFPPNLTGVKPEDYQWLDCTKIIIYNRWGRKIWEGSGCWDGQTMGGLDVSEGVYFYIFEIGYDDTNKLTKHGTVQVLRAASK